METSLFLLRLLPLHFGTLTMCSSLLGGWESSITSGQSQLSRSPLISMLQYIQEEQVVSPHTRIVLHYLVKLQRDALFIDKLCKIKNHFGDLFDGNLWITRQATAISDLSLPPETTLQVHRPIVYSQSEIGTPWGWWTSFSDHVLQHFDTMG